MHDAGALSSCADFSSWNADEGEKISVIYALSTYDACTSAVCTRYSMCVCCTYVQCTSVRNTVGAYGIFFQQSATSRPQIFKEMLRATVYLHIRSAIFFSCPQLFQEIFSPATAYPCFRKRTCGLNKVGGLRLRGPSKLDFLTFARLCGMRIRTRWDPKLAGSVEPDTHPIIISDAAPEPNPDPILFSDLLRIKNKIRIQIQYYFEIR
jgi:hypothetical protein